MRKVLLAVREIATDISLTPAGEVPFPAVIIDLGGEVDPLGYVASRKGLASEDDVGGKSFQRVDLPAMPRTYAFKGE